MSSPEPEPVSVDPAVVLNKVQQGSELGAALVKAASWQVLAEHYAAELGRLRQDTAKSDAAVS